MPTEIPPQIAFEHLLSHTFPGFFLAITIFMLLDVWSPSNLTLFVIKDINGLIAFTGFILLIGTICGVIIDNIHHSLIEDAIFKKQTSIKEWILAINYCIPLYKKIYVFNWNEIPGKDEEKLKEFLRQEFSIYWLRDAEIIKTGNGKTIKVVHELSNNENYVCLTLDATNTEVILKTNDHITSKLSAKMEKSGIDIYKNEKNESDANEESDIRAKIIADLDERLTYQYFFKKFGSNAISLEHYIRNAKYCYSEFFSNTFISSIPFSLVVPFYLQEVLNLPWKMCISISFLSLLLACFSLYSSYDTYYDYYQALFSVIRGYTCSNECDGPDTEKIELTLKRNY